jgi:hypothetical protein
MAPEGGDDGDDDNATTGPAGALSTPPCETEAPAVGIPIEPGTSRGGSVIGVPMAIRPAGCRA